MRRPHRFNFSSPPLEIEKPNDIHTEFLNFFQMKVSKKYFFPQLTSTKRANHNQKLKWNQWKQSLQNFISQGASVTQSHTLHFSVANNCYNIVKCFIELEHGAIDVLDEFGKTPLKISATSAAVRLKKDGIQNTTVVEILLAERANRDLCDASGMTAYGHFVNARREYNLAIQSIMGNPVSLRSASCHPSEERFL